MNALIQRPLVMLFFGIATIVSGCGGSSDGNSQSDTQAEISVDEVEMMVTSVSPNLFAEQVERNASIEVTFNEDYFIPSVTAESFQLMRNNELVEGEIEHTTSTTIEFTPIESLNILSDYTATLTTDVTDLGGFALGEEFSWSFSTRDGIWAERMDSDSADLSRLVVAIDGSNEQWFFVNADTEESAEDEILVYSSSDELGIFDPVLLSTNDDGYTASSPVRYASLASGTLLITWIEDSVDDGTRRLQYSLLDLQSGVWQEADTVVDTSNSVSRFQVAAGGSGSRPVVAYREEQPGSPGAWDAKAVFYDGESDEWVDEITLEVSSDTVAAIDVAMNTSGHAQVVWLQSGEIYSSRYNAITQSWTLAQPVDDPDALEAEGSVEVTALANGEFMAFWEQTAFELALRTLHYNRVDENGNWGEPDNFGTLSNPVQFIAASDHDNNVIVAATFVVPFGSTDTSLSYARFDAEAGDWVGPFSLESEGLDVEDHSLTVDASGNAMVVWDQRREGSFDGDMITVEDPETLWTRRYNASTEEWEDAEILNDVLPGVIDRLSVDITTSGEVVAGWFYEDGPLVTINARLFE